MKYRNLREIVPVVAIAAVLSAGYFNENVLAKDKTEDNIEPKYLNGNSIIHEHELIILNLSDKNMDNYDMINSDDIESIIYSDDKTNVTINLKNSDIYYTGYYNAFYQKYIYMRNNNKIKVFAKSN